MEQKANEFYSHVKKPNFWLKDDLKLAKKFGEIYNEQLLNQSTNEAIPRLIHFIWLGSKSLPLTFDRIWKMWATHHPGFQLKLWGEADLEKLELTNRPIICDKTLNPALRADFLRIELLFMFGGTYADVDMTCERPLTPLLTQGSFITGVANTQAFEVNNGLIISK